jgi:hypothetical protein
MRLDLFKIVVLAAALFALAFVSAPWFAFRALKAAAQAEDVSAIAELVDFPQVRKSLTAQLVTERPVTAETPSIWQDPLGAMRRALEQARPPEPVVDGYLTAEGLSALTRGYRPGTAPALPPPPGSASGQVKQLLSDPLPKVVYWDTDRSRIAVDRPTAKGRQTMFTFERKALFTWKLVHIQLPKDER